MLQLKGFNEEENAKIDEEFLLEMLELMENIENEENQEILRKKKQEVEKNEQHLEKLISNAFKENQPISELATLVSKLRYYNRASSELQSKLMVR